MSGPDLSGIEQQRDFYAEAWDAEQNRSAALQEQLAAVEAVVAQAQHPALRCATLAEDVELIWRGRVQARQACSDIANDRDDYRKRLKATDQSWAKVAAERDAAVARAEAAEQAVQRVRELHQKRAFTKYEYCVECDVDERAAPWPCDTIRALDGTP